MSGLTLDHSMSSSPVSWGPGVYVHARLTVSPWAFWMVCGPEAVTSIACVTSDGSENYHQICLIHDTQFFLPLIFKIIYLCQKTNRKVDRTNFSLKHINMGFKLWACAHKQSHSGVGADLRLIGLLSQTEEDLRVWRWNKSKSGIFVEMSCVLIWNSRGSLVVRNILVNDGENWMSRHEKCTWQVAVRSCFWADTHPADSLFMAMDFNYCW